MKDAHIHFHKQPYSLDIVSKMVESAVKRGVDELNLLDHTSKFKEFAFLYEETKNEPEMYSHYKNDNRYISIKEYLEFIELVRKQNYPVKINFGLEVCYFENVEDKLREELSKYNFDFLIGSVHHIDGFGYDYGKELWAGRDVDHLWKRYIELTYKLIQSNIFTHLAHPDALKIYGFYPSFDLTPYYEKVAKLLNEHNMSTEDNYGFIRYGFNNYGIDKPFLNILNKEGVTVYKSSDAHDYKDVGRFSPNN